jgi:hypothetical protein
MLDHRAAGHVSQEGSVLSGIDDHAATVHRLGSPAVGRIDTCVAAADLRPIGAGVVAFRGWKWQHHSVEG